jgi:hypothetical protein
MERNINNTSETISRETTLDREPILIQRFMDIKTIPDIQPPPSEFAPVLSDESSRQHSFDEAKKAFLYVFDNSKLEQHLRSEDPNEPEFKYLKRIRRIGLILRAQYRFLDASHSTPKPLQDFLSLLGDFNDRYWHPQKKKNGSKLVQALESLEEPGLTIDLADKASFDSFATGTGSRIQEALSEPRLPMNKFHDLRKDIRTCADLLSVAASEDYGGKVHWLFASLLALSIELGEMHDEHVQSDLRGEAKYQETVVDINPSIKAEFAKLHPFFEKVIGTG